MTSNTDWGALWTVVYNFAWDIAWFAFKRNEWESAMAAAGRSVPWTAEVVVIT